MIFDHQSEEYSEEVVVLGAFSTYPFQSLPFVLVAYGYYTG